MNATPTPKLTFKRNVEGDHVAETVVGEATYRFTVSPGRPSYLMPDSWHLVGSVTTPDPESDGLITVIANIWHFYLKDAKADAQAVLAKRIGTEF